MFIGLSGKQRSGKDTAVPFFLHELTRQAGERGGKPGKWAVFRFSDPLYRAAGRLWNDSQPDVGEKFVRENKDDFRPILQCLGILRRKHSPQYFRDRLIDEKTRHQNLLISDVRMRADIDDIRAVFSDDPGVLIRMSAPGDPDRGGIVGANHATETDLDNYQDWDYSLTNDGSLGELYDRVADVVNQIMQWTKMEGAPIHAPKYSM